MQLHNFCKPKVRYACNRFGSVDLYNGMSLLSHSQRHGKLLSVYIGKNITKNIHKLGLAATPFRGCRNNIKVIIKKVFKMRNQVKVKEYRRSNYVMSMWEYTSEKRVFWSLTCVP